MTDPPSARCISSKPTTISSGQLGAAIRHHRRRQALVRLVLPPRVQRTGQQVHLEQRKRVDGKLALLAAILPVHHVRGAPMVGRGAGELEAHRAQAALERPLAGMDAGVVAQPVAAEELLRTELALVRAVLLMDAHVLVEDELARKVAPADRTGERVLLVVRGHVLLQVAGTDEGGRTQRAADWSAEKNPRGGAGRCERLFVIYIYSRSSVD